MEEKVSKDYCCPLCGGELWILEDGSYECVKMGCSFYKIHKKIILLNSNRIIELGKVREYSKVGIAINTETCECVIYTNSGKMAYGPYKLDDISIDVVLENKTIYKTSKGVTPMIVGGLLFGAAGAVAGSVASSKKEKEINKKVFLVTITTNDTEFTGFQVATKHYNLVHDLVNTVENTKKKFYESQSEDKHEKDKPDKEMTSDEAYNNLLKLKELYDKKIIDDNEYNEKRSKFLKYI